MEPDRRYGSGVPQVDDPVVVFAADGGAPIDPAKPGYRAMKVRVEVAALAAASDGDASSDDLQSIVGTIRADNELTQIERLRLIGYAVTIFKSPPKQERILRRLSDTREEERKAIAAAATAVVGSTGERGPQERPFPRETAQDPQAACGPGLFRPASRASCRRSGARVGGAARSGHQDPEGGSGGAARSCGSQRHPHRQAQACGRAARHCRGRPKSSPGFSSRSPQPAEPAKHANGTASAFSGLDAEHAELVIYLQIIGEVGRAGIRGEGESPEIAARRRHRTDQRLVVRPFRRAASGRRRKHRPHPASARKTCRIESNDSMTTSAAKIRPRDRDTILQALSAGVVPRTGLAYIQVGRASGNRGAAARHRAHRRRRIVDQIHHRGVRFGQDVLCAPRPPDCPREKMRHGPCGSRTRQADTRGRRPGACAVFRGREQPLDPDQAGRKRARERRRAVRHRCSQGRGGAGRSRSKK